MKPAKTKGAARPAASFLKTRVKQLEAEVERFRQADKLRDEFLDVISHELKTPLIPIMGYIDIWAEGGLDEEMKKKSLEVVRRNAKRLKDLIDDILLVSKIESGKLEFDFRPLDLSEAARRVTEDLKTFASDKKIELTIDLEKDMPKAEVDSQWIGEVLQNLVHNAVKFTPNNGKVTVKILKKGGQARVQVIDTGIGIEKKHLSHLFRKFYQVDSSATRQFGGTGLGLDICKSIVEKHGGRVWVESEVGLGSTFSFEVPLIHPKNQGNGFKLRL